MPTEAYVDSRRVLRGPSLHEMKQLKRNNSKASTEARDTEQQQFPHEQQDTQSSGDMKHTGC
jgi:hypothetical protein